MGFGSVLRKVAKVVTAPLRAVENNIPGGKIIVPAAIAIVGTPAAAAGYEATKTYAEGGSFKDSAIAGATSYAASAAGSAAGDYAASTGIGKSIGLNSEIGSIINGSESIGPQSINLGIGDIVGQQTSNAIGARVANATVGSILGKAAVSALTSSAKSGSDITTVDPTIANSPTTTNINTGATTAASAPTIGDTAVQQSGDDVARAAAEAQGRTASILSDQTDTDVTNGNPNILKRKSLLSD